jgi:hypothetical protein
MSENLNVDQGLIRQIDTIYKINDANTPIILYEGLIKVTNGQLVRMGQGTLHYSWHPFQAIGFEFEDHELHFDGLSGTLAIYLEAIGITVKGELSYVTQSLSEHGVKSKYIGTIRSAIYTNETKFSLDTPNIKRIEFFLANLQEILFLNEGAGLFKEDIPVIFDGWQILINKRDDWWMIRDKLREFSGYGITHTCSVQRNDGSVFSFNEAKSVAQQIGLYLSYLRKEWSSSLLPLYFNNDNKVILWDWSEQGKISPWKHSLTDNKSLNIGAVEAGLIPFLKLCRDSLWSNPINSALRWYIECSSKSSGVEGSIIIQMAAFELLSWMIFVQSPATKKHSNNEFSKMDLRRKIHKLLEWVGGDRNINELLYPHLHLFAKAEAISIQKDVSLYTNDAPALLKRIRDALIHPEASKQAFLSRIPPIAINEAYKLGQEYLEAILKKIFGYNSYIANPKRTSQ